jgi:hypothetical protein
MRATNGRYEVFIDKDYGYFEHEIYGDEAGGGLWFENKELIDFDGMMVLPIEVAECIKELGYKVDVEQYCY